MELWWVLQCANFKIQAVWELKRVCLIRASATVIEIELGMWVSKKQNVRNLGDIKVELKKMPWWICHFTTHHGTSVWLGALLGQKSSLGYLANCKWHPRWTVLKSGFIGSPVYLWNMLISLSNWRMACVVWVRVLGKSGDGGRSCLGVKIHLRWAKIPAVGKRTTTAPLLHNSRSTGSTFDAWTLSSSMSSFSFSHVVRRPIASLDSCTGCSSAAFTLYTCRLPEFTWFTCTSPPDLRPPQETGPANWTTWQIPNWERWQLFGTTLLDLTAMGEGV